MKDLYEADNMGICTHYYSQVCLDCRHKVRRHKCISGSEDEREDITPGKNCYNCHHLFCNIYFGYECKLDGVNQRAKFWYRDFNGKDVRCLICPKWQERGYSSIPEIYDAATRPNSDYMIRRGYEEIQIDGRDVWVKIPDTE